MYPKLDEIKKTLLAGDRDDNKNALGAVDKIQTNFERLNSIFTGQFIGAFLAGIASICFSFPALASACVYAISFSIYFKVSEQRRELYEYRRRVLNLDETAPDPMENFIINPFGMYDGYFSRIDEENPALMNLPDILEEVEKDVSALDSSVAIAIGALTALLFNSSYSHMFNAGATPPPHAAMDNSIPYDLMADVFFSGCASFFTAAAPSLLLGGKSKHVGICIGGVAAFFQAGAAVMTERPTRIAPSF